MSRRTRTGRARRHAAILLGVILAGACRTAVLEPVPDPLPEAMEWSTEASQGAFLGLKTQENDSGSLEDLFFEPGARVTRVVESSPAAAAGVRPGDVVLALGGEEVNDPGALEALLARRSAGERVELRVRRGDTVFGLEVELAGRAGAEAPDPEVLYRVDRARTRAGWLTTPEGVRLVTAAEGSPVREAGIGIGSHVVAVDGQPVRSARELERTLAAMDPGRTARFEVVGPDGERRSERVRLLGPRTYVAGFGVPVLVHYAHDPDGPTTDFVLVDLWIVSLFRYAREGNERRWRILRFFRFSSGIGELSE